MYEDTWHTLHTFNQRDGGGGSGGDLPTESYKLEDAQSGDLLLMDEILHHLGCIKPCK